jgi:hypothetical protein
MKSINAPCGSWTWSMTSGYASATLVSTQSGPAATCTSPRRVTVGSNDAEVATHTSWPRSCNAARSGASCANTDSPGWIVANTFITGKHHTLFRSEMRTGEAWPQHPDHLRNRLPGRRPRAWPGRDPVRAVNAVRVRADAESCGSAVSK